MKTFFGFMLKDMKKKGIVINDALQIIAPPTRIYRLLQPHAKSPFPKQHTELVDQLRSFYLVGGMPAAVTEWVETRSYLDVTHVH